MSAHRLNAIYSGVRARPLVAAQQGVFKAELCPDEFERDKAKRCGSPCQKDYHEHFPRDNAIGAPKNDRTSLCCNIERPARNAKRTSEEVFSR